MATISPHSPGTGGTTGSGSGSTTSPGWNLNLDPKWVGGGLIGVIVSLIVYIWHDKTSDIEKLQNTVDELSKAVARIETTTSIIQRDLNSVIVKQDRLETLIHSSSEEIKKQISASTSEVKAIIGNQMGDEKKRLR